MYRYNTREMPIAVRAIQLFAYLESAALMRMLLFGALVVNGLLGSDIVSPPGSGRQLQILIHGQFLCVTKTKR
jgi:hypothetical protein